MSTRIAGGRYAYSDQQAPHLTCTEPGCPAPALLRTAYPAGELVDVLTAVRHHEKTHHPDRSPSAEIEISMGARGAGGWRQDGHHARIVFEGCAVLVRVACPHGEEAPLPGGNRAALPECRREPDPASSEPTVQCEVVGASYAWMGEELWDREATEGYEVTSCPFPVAWRRDSDGVWLKPLPPEPVPAAGGEDCGSALKAPVEVDFAECGLGPDTSREVLAAYSALAGQIAPPAAECVEPHRRSPEARAAYLARFREEATAEGVPAELIDRLIRVAEDGDWP